MALAGNGMISQNRHIGLPLLKLQNVPCPAKASVFSSPRSLFQSNPRVASPSATNTLACVARTDVSDMEFQSLNSSSTTSIWSEFARNVSGEWDGFGADFTTEGKPIELPESVVPEAYREWEVKVYDWQTQCPTLAQPEELVMVHKIIKLLPTVGCEADAATRYSIDERNVGGVDNKVSAFAYQSSGSYVAVWPVGDHGDYEKLELEHCLINPQDRESRVRIFQVVRVANKKVELESISIFCELWYGPFRNGDQLGGCAIRDSAFASTAALKASEVVGVWQGHNSAARFDTAQTDIFQELLDDSSRKFIRDEHELILLPKQLWCSLKGSEDSETCCEVGWLYDNGCAVTSRCIFSSNAKLKKISIARETAIME